tara:strand:+ start:408 stop:566 length:159 start_codon:yes stop_codon:yes gene_type:complete
MKELSNINEVDRVINQILNEMKEDDMEYTCCGDEVTADVEDLGLCPTCLEHF